MDTDLAMVLGWIIGIVVLVEFFHIGYLVNAIRKQLAKQTKVLLASTGVLVGKPGYIQTWPKFNKEGVLVEWGTVNLLGENWECTSIGRIKDINVKVKAVDGIRLTVEAAK